MTRCARFWFCVCDGGVRRVFDGAVLGRASVWSERRDSSQTAVAPRRPRDSEGDECSSVTLHRALKSAPRRPHDSEGDECNSQVTLHRARKSASRRARASSARAVRRAGSINRATMECAQHGARYSRRVTRDMRPYSCRVARRSLLRTLTRSAHTTTTLSPNASIRRTPRSTLSRAPALSMTMRAPARLLGHGGRARRADA